MGYKHKPLTRLLRAIKAFENAVHEKAFEGSIPVFSDDPDEQAALDAAHTKIRRDYSRALNRLIKLYEELHDGKENTR